MPCNSEQLAELIHLQQPVLQEALAQLSVVFQNGTLPLAQKQHQQQISLQGHSYQVHLSPNCLGVWNTHLGTLKLIGNVVSVLTQQSRPLYTLNDEFIVVLDP